MAQWIWPRLLQGKTLFLLDFNCLLLSHSKHVIRCFVAYSCSERCFKDVLHWEEELMLVQVDCLHTCLCVILCRFPEDTVCLVLLCGWICRQSWVGDSICAVLPPRELVLTERAVSVSWPACRRLARRDTWVGEESAFRDLPLSFPSLYWRVWIGEVEFSLMWIWLSNLIKKLQPQLYFTGFEVNSRSKQPYC